MSIKIYEAYRIKNVDFSKFFIELNSIREILIKEISDNVFNLQMKFLNKLNEVQKLNGFIKNKYFEFDFTETKEYKNNKISSKCSLIVLAKEYFEYLETKKVLDIYDFSICFFPYKNDMLFIPYSSNSKYLNIFKNNISNIEEYGYWDNVDAPYEEFKEEDVEYVSKKDWNDRKLAWENVLLNKTLSIPSLNGLQFDINHKLFTDMIFNIDRFPKELRSSIVDIKKIDSALKLLLSNN